MGDLFAPAPTPAATGCAGCGGHHPDARDVTLYDGTTVSSYSEAWRHECEARSILNLPTLPRRQARLDHIERWRGKAAADQLRDTMLAIWNARQEEKMRR